MKEETINFIAQMFNAETSVPIKQVEQIAAIKQDFMRWAESEMQSRKAEVTTND